MNVQQTQISAADTLSRREAGSGWHAQIPDDKAMLRAARDLTKDISAHRADIYWADMIASALVGYGALAGAILTGSLPLAIALGVVSVLALYRALLFIHEISHFRNGALPGFRTAWNALVGVPMLTPSFMYEGVHTLHHKRTQYGTIEDPEYLPLALMKPWSLPAFVLIALLAPVELLLRFAVLVSLGAIVPPIRRRTWQRLSALAINPDFRRRNPEGDLRRRVLLQEALKHCQRVFQLIVDRQVGRQRAIKYAGLRFVRTILMAEADGSESVKNQVRLSTTRVSFVTS